jgi:type II secretory ATPase GspE/PulE/Tfp pilus assembly ATPase PilB-like protein
MTESLPNNPSLEQLKNQAKDIHKAYKSGNESACDILKLLSNFAQESNQELLAKKISLQQVQHALAMSYGFDSWQALRQSVAAIRSTSVPEERDPVTRFIDKMLKDTIVSGASHLYFEPDEKAYHVRYRLNGVVHEVARPPVGLGPEIAENLKLRASIDITDRLRPESGHITLEIKRGDTQYHPISETKTINFRVKTFPVLFGEKFDLQILDTPG